jgi:hypothetical protein
MTGLTKLDGYGITVGSQYADKFKGLLDDLEANGVKVDRSQSGGYNYRNIAGTNRLSNHAYGRALDVNWTDNARGTKGKIDPNLARALASKHGLVWGGDWSNPDPMHFEVAGALNAAGGQHNHSHTSTASQPGTPGQPALNAGAAPMAYAGATPDSVAQARKMAQALMSQGLSSAPVQHWTQALGRVLQAGVGSMWDSQANAGEKEGRTSAQEALAAALANENPQSALQGVAAHPWIKGGDDLMLAAFKQKLGPGAAEYGKAGQVFQGADGRFYSVQFASNGERKIMPVEVPGAGPPTAAGQQPASVPLSPARGVMQVGDEIVDKATGGTTRQVGAQLQAGKDYEGTGTAAAKTRAELPQEKARLGLVTRALDDLEMQSVSLSNSKGLPKVVGGYQAKYAPNVSGDARNAGTELDNLKNKIAGNVLSAMREASKTGGAVGNVTEREWPRLENMIANLDPLQEEGQFRDNLAKVVAYAQQVKAMLVQAYEEDAARVGSAPGATKPAVPAAPAGGSKLKFLGVE